MEYGLSVIENPAQNKYKTMSEVKSERGGHETWRSIIKCDTDKAIRCATYPRQFVTNLQNLGYEVKVGSGISVRPQGRRRFFRLAKNFGDRYLPDSIANRIDKRDRYMSSIPKPTRLLDRPKKLPPVPKGSIRAIYRHYLYLLGFWKNKAKSCNARMHYLLREDITKLDAYIADIRLMEKERIETRSQLDAFYHKTTRAIEELIDERKPLYSIARSAVDPDKAITARNRITPKA
jgi:hypothetical protein